MVGGITLLKLVIQKLKEQESVTSLIGILCATVTSVDVEHKERHGLRFQRPR